MKKKMSLVGEWFQESIELQVTMLSYSQEAHHIITLTLQGAVMPEKKNLPFFRSYFVYGYYFVAFKITPTQSTPLQ